MSDLMIRHLSSILQEGTVAVEQAVYVPIVSRYLKEKEKGYLNSLVEELGGEGPGPLVQKVTFDFRIDRQCILWDSPLKFNRYRLSTFRSQVYTTFDFSFVSTYKRLCRSKESEALKSGLHQQAWEGSALAKKIFGEADAPGDFYKKGAPGWKFQAYTDAQYDLLARIHGYKLIRLCPYETLMTGGSLKQLGQLLIRPTEDQRAAIFSYIQRKLQ